jgi:NADH:ubiquinone oxidoreductase subunit 6 (subunit J)
MSSDIVQIGLFVLIIGLAILTTKLENILYAAICSSGMSISLGGLYWTMYAPYVGIFQMLIYGGALTVLFIVVVMYVRGPEID